MTTQENIWAEQASGPRDRLLVGYFLNDENYKIIARLESEAKANMDHNPLFPIFEFLPINVGCRTNISEHSPAIDFFIFKPSEEFSLICMSQENSDTFKMAHQRLERLVEVEMQVPTFANLKNVLPTFHRRLIANFIERITEALNEKGLRQFGTLKWEYIDSVTNRQTLQFALQNVGYPVIIKKGIATGVDGAHDVAVASDYESASKVLHDSNLIKFESSSFGNETDSLVQNFASYFKHLTAVNYIFTAIRREGVILQEYVPDHGGIVYKLYVVGDKSYVVVKRSLPISSEQVIPGSLPIFLDESEIRAFSSPLPPLENECPLSSEVISAIAAEAQTCMGLCVFGIDFLMDNEKKKFYIIDINFFPSFRGVPNGQKYILEYIHSKSRLEPKL